MIKFTKKQLTTYIKEAVRKKLLEMSLVDKRMSLLDRFRVENDLSSRELLEDVLETLDDRQFKAVVANLKDKYGYMP